MPQVYFHQARVPALLFAAVCILLTSCSSGAPKKGGAGLYKQLKKRCLGSGCTGALAFTAAQEQDCFGTRCRPDIYFSFDKKKLIRIRCVRGDRFAIIIPRKVESTGKAKFVIRVKNKDELKPQGITKQSIRIHFNKDGLTTGCYGDILFASTGK